MAWASWEVCPWQSLTASDSSLPKRNIVNLSPVLDFFGSYIHFFRETRENINPRASYLGLFFFLLLIVHVPPGFLDLSLFMGVLPYYIICKSLHL